MQALPTFSPVFLAAIPCFLPKEYCQLPWLQYSSFAGWGGGNVEAFPCFFFFTCNSFSNQRRIATVNFKISQNCWRHSRISLNVEWCCTEIPGWVSGTILGVIFSYFMILNRSIVNHFWKSDLSKELVGTKGFRRNLTYRENDHLLYRERILKQSKPAQVLNQLMCSKISVRFSNI